jgi:hypothetical protein
VEEHPKERQMVEEHLKAVVVREMVVVGENSKHITAFKYPAYGWLPPQVRCLTKCVNVVTYFQRFVTLFEDSHRNFVYQKIMRATSIADDAPKLLLT